MLDRLATEAFDVVVIGGGITGVGVALDAATRGLRVALVERDDLASGTSSKSSKLVHGGLRYLQSGEVRLVYEALHERQRLLRNAPHLVAPLTFMIPILTRDGVVSKKVAKALGSALWTYDLTGGWRIGARHRRIRAEQAAAHAPTMPRDRLSGAFLYHDAEADDARLTLTVARSAAAAGAVVATRCEVVEVTHEQGRATGVVVRDTLTERTIAVRAAVVVNAAGVWLDQIRELDEGVAPGSIRPAKGVHVTVPWDRLRNDVAVVIPVPKDRRSLFVVPWGRLDDGTYRYAYVGTTDTDDGSDLDDPQCAAADLDYVLNALNHSFSPVGGPITVHDVTGVWAGLRPLVTGTEGSRTADLSRRHAVTTSEHGVVAVAGGKLTTYRQMAADTVDEVMRQLGRRGRSRTARHRLAGARGHRAPGPGASPADRHLASRYGTEARLVRALLERDPSLAAPLVPGLPYLRAEAVHAVRHEMACTLDDVLVRRTRAHLFDRAGTLAAAPEVARLMAAELGWDETEIDRQIGEYTERCRREVEAAATTAVPK